MSDIIPPRGAEIVPPEVWASPPYVERQIALIEDALTQVLFGDYNAVVQTDGGDPVWGALAMHINTGAARNPPVPRGVSMLWVLPRVAPAVLRARVDGSYRRSPFFRDGGEAIVRPYVLTDDERSALLAHVVG